MNCLKCYNGLRLWLFYSHQAGGVCTKFFLLCLQFVGHLQRLFCQIDIHQCLFVGRDNEGQILLKPHPPPSPRGEGAKILLKPLPLPSPKGEGAKTLLGLLGLGGLLRLNDILCDNRFLRLRGCDRNLRH